MNKVTRWWLSLGRQEKCPKEDIKLISELKEQAECVGTSGEKIFTSSETEWVYKGSKMGTILASFQDKKGSCDWKVLARRSEAQNGLVKRGGPRHRIRSHQILQTQLPSTSLTEYLRLPNFHSLWNLSPGIQLHCLKCDHYTFWGKKKKKKTIWEQCEGITRMGTHPSEEWRKLSRSFSSSLQKLLDFWVLNSHRLRNKQNVSWEGDASAVTTDQWATCLPHQCWSDRALTDGTRCGFSPRRYCFTVGWKYISQISWSKEKLHPREF